MPLAAGHFSDTGYRFVKNEFERKDTWIPFVPGTKLQFFHLELFNHDNVIVPYKNFDG